MLSCPMCGAENGEGNALCRQRGTRLGEFRQNHSVPSGEATPQDQTMPKVQTGSSLEDDVKNVVVRRFDGIKNRDEAAVKAVMDESYSKFDDWAPYRRQDGAEALENEFSAFKVLSNYTYELKDFKVNVFGDLAVATFTMHYQGTMRNEQFDVTSRVTTVLRKQGSAWKVVHEHFSRFPEEMQQQQQRQGRSRVRFPV
jgi:ketosteroid isomerase-like protein